MVEETKERKSDKRLAAIMWGSKPWFVFARAIYPNGDKIPGVGGINKDKTLSYHGKNYGNYERVEVIKYYGRYKSDILNIQLPSYRNKS